MFIINIVSGTAGNNFFLHSRRIENLYVFLHKEQNLWPAGQQTSTGLAEKKSPAQGEHHSVVQQNSFVGFEWSRNR